MTTRGPTSSLRYSGNDFLERPLRRSGDFVDALIHQSRTVDEYAFALGALAHYASDNAGHPIVNRALPILYPQLQPEFGDEVLFAESPARHVMAEFAFDVLQIARGTFKSDSYQDLIGFEVAAPLLERKVGVVVHHVASVYPIEITLAQTLAAGKPVAGVTMAGIHEMNAAHAKAYDAVTKDATLDLLRRNSAAAATAIRALSDAELDAAATASLYSEAPITCQFMLENHAVRHSYHHLSRIPAALNH